MFWIVLVTGDHCWDARLRPRLGFATRIWAVRGSVPAPSCLVPGPLFAHLILPVQEYNIDSVLTRPSALGMLDPVVKSLEILGAPEFSNSLIL